MKPLKLSILGVRGIVGEALTPELVVTFAQAFGTYIEGGPIFVSRDTRPSGVMIASSVIAGLLATGYEVIDLGVCPTPAMELAVRRHNGAGGVAITAGHNPSDWNALKFVAGTGRLLNAYQGEELLDVFHQGEFARARWDGLKPLRHQAHAVPEYVEALLEQVDREAIRKRRFKVAVDCCNGACVDATMRFLTALGCNVLAINDEVERPFPHDPEPNPDNMSQLRAMVKASGADIGFAQDADGSRLGVVTEKWDALSEEYTLCLIAEMLLQSGDTLVTNSCTTRAVEDIAARRGARTIRTKVGEPHIVETMLFHDAALGGEGSGGIVLPRMHHVFDSTAAIAYILDYLARTDRPISALAGSIPRYYMVKERVPCPPERAPAVMARLREMVDERPDLGNVDFTDGIRLERGRSWVHLRPSMTEPVLRIIAESETAGEARSLVDEWGGHVRSFLL
ncbi:MAG TPA: phosphoglucosamine mutase [Armatimonadota bacterium]|nr:phosphoglucosamine mutase [Armatimonadota bacterium]HOJ23265.1 phosphoglucosamine mutase [Armatimonadota bacterium]HOM81209.1 phosphoglucosamine mutase [Armatimonadota bacterium]HPO74503.1 phosphoglucosamine mutase [Armatimonadota bacterium]HPT96703.1 phosphoglucosamine mutase [Armatimonadota bacterium]